MWPVESADHIYSTDRTLFVTYCKS